MFDRARRFVRRPGRLRDDDETQGARSLAPDGAPGWKASDEPLGVAMRAVARQLEPLGAVASRDAFGGFMSTGGRSTQRFELPAKSCMTLVAIAAQGVHDMDAAVYGPEGDLVAADSQPDAHPTIQLCAGELPRRSITRCRYRGRRARLGRPLRELGGSARESRGRVGVRPAVARGSIPRTWQPKSGSWISAKG